MAHRSSSSADGPLADPPLSSDLQQSTPRADVPVFRCVVYVSRRADGQVSARVGNLAGIETTAADERSALKQATAAFKLRIMSHVDNEEPIPWEEVRPTQRDDEQVRYIPVHL